MTGRPWSRRPAPWTALFVILFAGAWLTRSQAPAPGEAAGAAAQDSGLRYDTEYPAIGYASTPLTDRVAGLARAVEAGEARLAWQAPRGHLDALLGALDIDPASQALVFSKTSLQTGHISAATPRAIYFNDDTYVAWVQGASALEVASMDPVLGPVFRTISQPADRPPRFSRQFGRCLQCHDSFSLTGGGVPRFITGSGYTGASGDLLSHEGWILTSHKTPLPSRWGGWFVTGRPGASRHLGNVIAPDAAALQRLEDLRVGTLASLEGVLDTTPYPVPTSDVVALLVLEHQVTVQNAIARAAWDARTALDRASKRDADAASPARIAAIAEPLVEALFLVGEAPLPGPIAGTSGFAGAFAARGRRDSRGRSLRDLDLERRLFRYPLSYLVGSPAFDALPRPLGDEVRRRIAAILRGEDATGHFDHLSAEDRAAIREILTETRPGFLSS